MKDVKLYQGDALKVLPTLPSASVQCCVTSPPYYGLRDYGERDQIGLEPTPALYVAKLVAVFREVWRVLADDGTLWLNLGDSYATGARKPQTPDAKNPNAAIPQFQPHRQWRASAGKNAGLANRDGLIVPGLKAKDLIGIPWRVAFALQADGWFLRSDIIWHKPNVMPESVKDRPTKAHEYLFLLSKSERYLYDGKAIQEACESGPSDKRKMVEKLLRIGGKHKTLTDPLSKANVATRIGQRRSVGGPETRNRRSVWTVTTVPNKDAHFAMFPPKLVEPCILAGSRPGDTILDPFAGACTAALVARAHGRAFIGIDLSREYLAMGRRRIRAARKAVA